ncbi:MAG: tRNA-uridine aminocarboxypropyltransferase [Sulfurovum sp.]|nr:tRNA-uridine aminocarboxypropyltransferase [Sulfurovum sp.]
MCYQCYRPHTSCMCSHITPLETHTRFVILMHPKEFRKTKNGTGHFTNLSLKNCEIIVGIDFSKHKKINDIIKHPDNDCFVLYPSVNSVNLNESNIAKHNKNTVLFLIDSTWPCSRAIFTASPNIASLTKVSFTHTKRSAFVFKEQPKAYCLSTIESTLCVLELLNYHQVENIKEESLQHFLKPFHKMVEYQVSCML